MPSAAQKVSIVRERLRLRSKVERFVYMYNCVCSVQVGFICSRGPDTQVHNQPPHPPPCAAPNLESWHLLDRGFVDWRPMPGRAPSLGLKGPVPTKLVRNRETLPRPNGCHVSLSEAFPVKARDRT